MVVVVRVGIANVGVLGYDPDVMGVDGLLSRGSIPVLVGVLASDVMGGDVVLSGGEIGSTP